MAVLITRYVQTAWVYDTAHKTILIRSIWAREARVSVARMLTGGSCGKQIMSGRKAMQNRYAQSTASTY